MARILIIDDDELFCRALTETLSYDGNEIICAYTLHEGLRLSASGSFDVVFLDVKLPDGNGLDKLWEIRNCSSTPEVIILTGVATSESAEMAIESGAWDYITKPCPISEMRLTLLRTLQYRLEKRKKKPANDLTMKGIIGSSSRMRDCYDLVAEAAAMDVNVLITGETGVGKELFARAIHDNSQRSGKNFVVIDCAALHNTLSESTLFGYKKGAFTGAVQDHEGLIKQSDGGTLFLDEVGELPLSVQKVFLRVLQERRFRPLGCQWEIESNFRLIAATNKNLDNLIKAGQFREDLLYRLRTLTIAVPSLRDHGEDIEQIALYHAANICQRSGLEAKTFSRDFIDALLSYDWPGNVRELVNAMERAISGAATAATLFRRHLPREMRVKLAQNIGVYRYPLNEEEASLPPGRDLPTLKDLRTSVYAKAERKYLTTLMKTTANDLGQACRISDLSRTRLYELLKKHKITILD